MSCIDVHRTSQIINNMPKSLPKPAVGSPHSLPCALHAHRQPCPLRPQSGARNPRRLPAAQPSSSTFPAPSPPCSTDMGCCQPMPTVKCLQQGSGDLQQRCLVCSGLDPLPFICSRAMLLSLPHSAAQDSRPAACHTAFPGQSSVSGSTPYSLWCQNRGMLAAYLAHLRTPNVPSMQALRRA